MVREYDIGVQSVVFGDRRFKKMGAELKMVGVERIELWNQHCPPEEYDPSAVQRTLDKHDVSVAGYGVVDLNETGIARKYAVFADVLGADYLTVNYPPKREDITHELIDLSEEFDLDVAIHNYSSVHHDDLSSVFSSIADVRNVLKDYNHPRLGACVDTGHFLVEAIDPTEVIAELSDRIVAVHLKDTSEAELEDVPGAGRLNLPFLFDLLDEHSGPEVPLIIEYELSEDRVKSGLQEGVENVYTALDGRK